MSKKKALPACEVCGAAYRRTYSDQRTCGRRCGIELRRRTFRDLTCGACGGAFRADTVSSRPPKLCFECRSKLPEQICTECSVPFVARRRKATCSVECQKSAERRYNRAYRATHVDVRFAGVKWDRSSRTCGRCGISYEPATTAQEYCSAACRQSADRRRRRLAGLRTSDSHRRRARRWGRVYTPIKPVVIFDRDRWVCQICFRPVPLIARVPHSLAPTLDHIIPMSEDGGDHVPSNVRLAHFICNVKRGVGGTDQLLLVG